MEGIRPAKSFLRLLSDRLGGDRFTLIDIGCSGGIDQIWRTFGNRLRAIGFDPNLQEIARLNAGETPQAGVEYVAAFVGPRRDDPAMAQMRSRDFWAHNPWGRLSVARTLEIRAAEFAKSTDAEKQRLNLWRTVPLADPEHPLALSDFLRERGIDDVDFIKLDVDGAELIILRSLEQELKETKVLGLCIEVNFFGSDAADRNTFHNIDRFMRAAGFALFDLSVRRYSAAALPAPYTYVTPAQGAWGRILQGDALYIRDCAAPEEAAFAATLSPQKLLKLSAIFSVFGLPDCAAEVLTRFRIEFAPVLDIDRALDALVGDCTSSDGTALNYESYMQDFERDGPRFYPSRRTSFPGRTFLWRYLPWR
jgi:FkbM family methyltransferase